MVGARRVARLVDERERKTAQLSGPLFRHLDAARVRRDNRRVVQRQAAAHIVEQHGQCGQMVDGAVEEALFLRGVQVDGHDAVRTGRREQREHELCGDRLTAQMFLVLT